MRNKNGNFVLGNNINFPQVVLESSSAIMKVHIHLTMEKTTKNQSSTTTHYLKSQYWRFIQCQLLRRAFELRFNQIVTINVNKKSVQNLQVTRLQLYLLSYRVKGNCDDLLLVFRVANVVKIFRALA